MGCVGMGRKGSNERFNWFSDKIGHHQEIRKYINHEKDGVTLPLDTTAKVEKFAPLLPGKFF